MMSHEATKSWDNHAIHVCKGSDFFGNDQQKIEKFFDEIIKSLICFVVSGKSITFVPKINKV